MSVSTASDGQSQGRLVISTLRFGSAEEVVIFASHLYTFVDPLPGLPDNHRFALIEEERYAPLRWMQSLDDPLICLPLLPAALLEFDTEKYRAPGYRGAGLLQDPAGRVVGAGGRCQQGCHLLRPDWR